MKRSILLLILLLPVLAILVEFGFFLKMTLSAPEIQKADLIAVFMGNKGRVEHGYRLANQAYGSHLLISPASPRAVELYRKRLDGTASFDNIVETRSRTTFENALHTTEIMTERNLRSVILVTSWDHVPRSYILLRLLSLGSGVRIQFSAIPTGRLDTGNWYRSSTGWKRLYNEMVDFWGSIYELASYRIRGELPRKAPNKSDAVAALRKLLLFELPKASD